MARAQMDCLAELIADNFAGGGGASTGIELATGRVVDIAVNHNPDAIRMHRTNHPHTVRRTPGRSPGTGPGDTAPRRRRRVLSRDGGLRVTDFERGVYEGMSRTDLVGLWISKCLELQELSRVMTKEDVNMLRRVLRQEETV